MERLFSRRRRKAAGREDAAAAAAATATAAAADDVVADDAAEGQDLLLALARVGIANAPTAKQDGSSEVANEDTITNMPRLLPSPPVNVAPSPRSEQNTSASLSPASPYLQAQGTAWQTSGSINNSSLRLSPHLSPRLSPGLSPSAGARFTDRGRSLSEKRQAHFGQKMPVLNLSLALDLDAEEDESPFGRADTDLKSVSTQATLWHDEEDDSDNDTQNGESRPLAEAQDDDQDDYFRKLFLRESPLVRQHSSSLSETREQKSPSLRLRRRSTRGRQARSGSVNYELSSSGTLHMAGFMVHESGVSPTPDNMAFPSHESFEKDDALSRRRSSGGQQSPMSQRSEASVESKTQSDDLPIHRDRSQGPGARHGLRALAASNTASPKRATPSEPIESKSLEFLNRVGKGASGVVFKALHRETMHLVAVKSVPVFDVTKRAQTVAEIEALYRDHHVPLASLRGTKVFPRKCPYIVGMHNAYVDRSESTINLVLEWMGGGSLEDRLTIHGPLSEREIACVLHCAFRGLRHLHGQRQLHRDIKPANMLLSHSSGLVKLSDFGIAHSFGSFSAANTFVGSLSYMAPERIKGNEDGYSYPADVWSLGLSALVCVTGRYPFQIEYDDQGYWGLVQAIGERPPPRLSQDRFSANLCDLVARCLQKDPQDRITAAAALDHPFLSRDFPFSEVVGSSFEPVNASGADEMLWQDLHRFLSLATGPVTREMATSLAAQVGVDLLTCAARLVSALAALRGFSRKRIVARRKHRTSQAPRLSRGSGFSLWNVSIPPPPSESGDMDVDDADFFGLPPDPDSFAHMQPPSEQQSIAHEMAFEFLRRNQDGDAILRRRPEEATLVRPSRQQQKTWDRARGAAAASRRPRRSFFSRKQATEDDRLQELLSDNEDDLSEVGSVDDEDDELPEYFLLYGKLYDYFKKIDEDGAAKVDIDSIVRWTLEDDKGSIEKVGWMASRLSIGVPSFMRPSGLTAAKKKASASPENGPIAEELRELEGKLRQFFSEVDAVNTDRGVEVLLSKFVEHGLLAVNIALYKQYGCNLNTMLWKAKHGSVSREPNSRNGIKQGTPGRVPALRKPQPPVSPFSTSTSSATSSPIPKSPSVAAAAAAAAKGSRAQPTKRDRTKTGPGVVLSKEAGQPCRRFAIDLAGHQFNACKNCGMQRADHLASMERQETRGAAATLHRKWMRMNVGAPPS
ncbi:Protein kinase, putative [Hondaea fermentalgiana]|uniref:mitogen-activated protein kinase kinase n=1 Tax=Hondaea fermentalgiana TaxID=2315210 RepID=A0A2R5G951_9STRA|nr:Protein kinase, putative [Hondaea fermentalgiana]|eukprot:GBG27065.1 Protein kinase, putative [Hondaea fermentalgiana]